MFTLLRKSLSLQMFIAMALGIGCGVFFGDFCGVFAPWETIYIRILKITTIPYLLCSIIYGIGNFIPSDAKRIFRKGLLFIGFTITINICMIYLITYLFPTSQHPSNKSYTYHPAVSTNFIDLLIPDNIFAALSQNLIPAVVIFGVLIGVALMQLKDKQPCMTILDTIISSLTKVTRWISQITPIGTFLIIADRVGTIQPSTIKQISTYLILYSFITAFLVFWIFPRITEMFAEISPLRWIKELTPIFLLAFTTNTVIVTLPFMVELIKKEAETLYRKDTLLQNQIQGIVSTVFNLPLGSLFITIFIFFITIFYDMPLTVLEQVKLFVVTFLTSIGNVGLGSLINAIGFLINLFGIPPASIHIYFTTIPIAAGFQSLISVIEVTTLSLLITLTSHNLLKWKWKSVIKKTSITIIPIVIFAVTFKYYIKLPIIRNKSETIYTASIETSVKTKIYTPQDKPPMPREGNPLERILKTQILRVGYTLQECPFSFYNNHKKLAGYDISFAYKLASDLKCSIEFIPINLQTISEDLNCGLYDIAVGAISITEHRLKNIFFSTPNLQTPITFVMKKKSAYKYKSIGSIAKNPNKKVVVLRGSSYEFFAQKKFPNSQIVLIDNYDEYFNKYSDGILIQGEFQAINWKSKNCGFTSVTPIPIIQTEVFGYAVALNADTLLSYINQWLFLKKHENFTKHQYNFWILGETEDTTKQPRWSILRNVLKWAP
jgi:proton glutamate symport protein